LLLSAPATFEVLLVEDLSRLTRDMAELLRVTTRLRLKGIELVGVGDGIATGHQGAKMHLAVKGPVSAHGRGYHPHRLEAAVLARFRAAMTPPMVSTLTEFVNRHVEAALRERSRGAEDLKTEILRLERQERQRHDRTRAWHHPR
jgi:hypothetical protein